ncbi:hypothetical protein AA13595_0380 [Gluconacetobacter johannae DSM 13595]|nr:hypothetical protein AA13595_0380 [Gluconacetobacter johannae DSM 13595]
MDNPRDNIVIRALSDKPLPRLAKKSAGNVFPPLSGHPLSPKPPFTDTVSGRSSGVEHNLAKVGVVGSNPIARSRFSKENQSVKAALRGRFLFMRLFSVGDAGSL